MTNYPIIHYTNNNTKRLFGLGTTANNILMCYENHILEDKHGNFIEGDIILEGGKIYKLTECHSPHHRPDDFVDTRNECCLIKFLCGRTVE